jgi:hypothetical protein
MNAAQELKYLKATRRNPWEKQISGGRTVMVCDAASRLSHLKHMTVAELRDVMDWPQTQQTVRAAAARQMAKLTAQFGKETN